MLQSTVNLLQDRKLFIHFVPVSDILFKRLSNSVVSQLHSGGTHFRYLLSYKCPQPSKYRERIFTKVTIASFQILPYSISLTIIPSDSMLNNLWSWQSTIKQNKKQVSLRYMGYSNLSLILLV